MDSFLRTVAERVGLERADVLGLALALAGCVLATVVALRVPLGLAPSAGHTGEAAPGGAVAAPAGPVGGGGASDGAGRAGDGGVVGTPPAEPADGPVAVVVHVTGEVVAAGVVELPAGARVADAVAAAGGTTDAAVLDGVNLARPLVDGEQVVVPDAAALDAVATTGPAGPALPPSTLPDGRLDLNTATSEQLQELPGVGEVTAGRIIAWRDEHGGFDDPAQLREVRGIGEVTWVGLRDLVGVR